MLFTDPILYHTCKNLLSTESIDSCMVSVDSQFTSFIYRYGLFQIKSCNSRSTSILLSITSRDLALPLWSYSTEKPPKDADNMANSADPVRTAPFSQSYLSKKGINGIYLYNLSVEDFFTLLSFLFQLIIF